MTLWLVLLPLILAECCHCLNPVLLVPGALSSQLQAYYTKQPPHNICGEPQKWFCQWIDPKSLLPFSVLQDCLVKTLGLNYNQTSKETFSPEFCKVESRGFGTVDTIAYLTEVKIPLSAYFAPIIKDLVAKFGYIANKDLLGAPYDWRKGPNEMDAYQENVKTLIERMSASSGGKPVIVIGHSLGNLHMVRLLNNMSQQWKDRYIKTFISISAPYSGAVKAVYGILTGFKIPGMTYLKPQVFQAMSITFPSIYYLLPSPRTWSSKNIVLTKYGNFSKLNLEQLMILSKVKNADHHYKNVVKYITDIRAPNVTMHCIYNIELDTMQRLDYTGVDIPLGDPVVTYGKGDGTVNLESLRQCLAWKDQQSHEVTEHLISKSNHFHALGNHQTIAIINAIIAALTPD